jgi:signal transduction histidine kinase
MWALTILLIAAVFYFGTVGVLSRSIDSKIRAISDRLVTTYADRPIADLTREIARELTDGIDSDTEIFLVTSASGQIIAGNLSQAPAQDRTTLGQLLNVEVLRNGIPSSARLIVRALPQGGTLYVGRDSSEQRSIGELVRHALEAALALALVLVVTGGYVFRQLVESRINQIRRTAHAIEAGDLNQRIPVSGDDEFARLAHDVNRMLDRIEQLMNGVRQVSNAIAHDLRTPLTRVRTRLDASLRHNATAAGLSDAARTAIDEIDGLITVFNKLLQIAEAESGLRTETFAEVDCGRIIQNMVDLYDAAAEEKEVRLKVSGNSQVWVRGDSDLLSSAVASLLDNAIKYAGSGTTVELRAANTSGGAEIIVEDDGAGVSDEELPRLVERFYRVDRSRSEPGNGLGLAIVSAIATLHGGSLELANSRPGLRAVIQLPALSEPVANLSNR